MKHLDEYRDPRAAAALIARIKKTVTRPRTIMEVCGGQTHAIVKNGLDQLLPEPITLLHGPGCPVCVTSVDLVDRAIALASRDNIIFCSFGDMLRVPGSDRDLLSVKASGGDVRAVYSPLDAIKIAQDNPDRQVVFFAIGFETTAPGNAMAVKMAAALKLENFSILSAQVLIPPAMEAILKDGGGRVHAFLAAGHVCTITGYREYERLAHDYGIPIAVTGFEPFDILQGIYAVVDMLEKGQAAVSNQYSRAVQRDGNSDARRAMSDLFRVVDRDWRGLGVIAESGLALNDTFQEYDAERRFAIGHLKRQKPTECISGLILQGRKKPSDCPAFGSRCTPQNPLGATMVSSEGACAAYYMYRKRNKS